MNIYSVIKKMWLNTKSFCLKAITTTKIVTLQWVTYSSAKGYSGIFFINAIERFKVIISKYGIQMYVSGLVKYRISVLAAASRVVS